MDELIYRSAKSIAKAIRDKEVSSVEAVDAFLKRIDEVNPKLNAVVQLATDRARAEAREADEALSRGESKGPLHGVPITLKDSLDTEGIITTGGTKGRESFVPEQDATVTARLRGAGAILMGKTNTPELTLAGETANLIYGRTNNPYDLSRMPGGSSGGAGAIIASGGSPLDMGSDTGGSIRGPAHFCGIAGIKPTSGRVPRTGHIVPFGMGAIDSLTQIGPMARYVEDLALALPIISGPDWRDPAIVPMPLGDPAAVDLKSLRVAVHTDNGLMTPTPETIDAVKAAAKALSDAGVTVEENCPAALQQIPEINVHFNSADGRAWVRRLLDKAGTTEIHPWLQRRLDEAKAIPTSDYTALLEMVDNYRSEMLGFMESYDAILCPACAFPALEHEGSFDDSLRKGFSYLGAYNITGWPGAVVRGGTSPEGLPIGVQVVARPWREDVALALAQQLETALGGWQRPPL
ncbi:MAG: amidase [Chloroflexi bacterium]|nr:amidase [Chloroflexota bacterium]